MNLQTRAISLTDDELESASGGYLQASKWREYASTQIFPVLNGLASSASANDKEIVSAVCASLQGTMIPGAAVAAPVYNLWTRYNSIYRPRLQSETVKRTMDQTLYKAKQYVDQNK